MSYTSLPDGMILHHRYIINRTYRLSGLGALYEASPIEEPTRRYAIKEAIVGEFDKHLTQKSLESFEDLSKALLKLKHPHIVKTLDSFILNDITYTVTDFVEGKDLERVIFDAKDGLKVSQVYEWAVSLTEALHTLHSIQPNPIIFRDLKPANIMLNTEGKLQLVDFGIAVLMEPGHAHTPLGTDGYAAPEQYMGEATPAIDIYGLGATLHQLLTRCDPRLEPPFSFHKRPIHDFNPLILPAFEEIVMQSVAHDVWDRYASALELLSALKQIETSIA